ncbi:MAG: methyltransferase domain-containing protein [Pacificimonas sp.]
MHTVKKRSPSLASGDLPDEYREIFNHRGSAYDEAMQRWPDARGSEFLNLFAHVELPPEAKVADVPSGGGYLKRWLPLGATLDAYDPSAEFRERGSGISPVKLSAPELDRDDYDAIVCLAALHHVADKAACFDGLARHVRPSGHVLIADVKADSRITRYLDGFVGQHNGTGHEGMYLRADDPFDFGREHPRVASSDVATLACPWVFPDRRAMIGFAGLLFGAASAGPEAIGEALDTIVGVREEGGKTILDWELTYISATIR